MGVLPNHDEFERKHAKQHPTPDPDCYACRLSTVSLQFTYGKEDFHGPTINERVKEHHDSNALHGRKIGRDYEATGNRWV